jgi:alpha-tubulin suppressor-like RCC1 family protein
MRRILSLLFITANLGIAVGVGVSVVSSTSTLAAVGDVKAAFGNSHAVALGSDGLVYAWGSLIPGATGSGSKDALSRPTLVPIPGTRTSVDVASTYNSSAAVASDGSVWAWGTLGLGLGDTDGTTGSRYLSPVRVEFPAGIQVRKVSGACESYLALDSSGEVWQWGNFYGVWNQSYAQPRKVEGISGATSITRGCSTSFAILADGSAKAWGSNGGGKIGDGTTTDRSTAVSVRLPGSRSFSSISVSSSHSLGLATDGTLWGWGGNSRGELGADANAVEFSVSPRQIVLSSGTGTITAIAASENSPGSVVVTSTNQVWEWGTWGQTGFVQNRRTLPSDIGSTILRSVALGSGAAIFAGNDGSLWARGGWGQADLDGNCGANASDYPMWVNGQTLPARSLVRVRSNGQFGSTRTEDRLTFARIDSGAGGSLPMDGSGTVPGSVGTQLTVVGTSPTSSCYNATDLTYSFSGDGGSTWVDSANITISTNSFGQTVVTASYTPSVSGRSRGLLKVSNPDGQSESYRFWLGVAAVVSTGPVEGGQTTLPIVVSAMGSGITAAATSVGIGTDGLLYAWGGSEAITGVVGSQANPKKLVTPNGVTFVDVAIEVNSGSTAAAAVGSDGKIYVWGSGGADYIQGGTSSNAAPTPLTMPAGVSARQVQLTPITWSTNCSTSCVTVYGFIGVFVTTTGQVYGWGGGTESTSPNYSRGGTPVVEPALAGFNIDELAKPSSYMSGVSFLAHSGTDIYRWSVYRQSVCTSGTCSLVNASLVLRVGATRKIVQLNSMSEMRWKVGGALELHQCELYMSSQPCTTSSVVSLPGGRVVKDIGTIDGQGLVLATDGTLWSIWSGSNGFNRVSLPAALAGVSRFTGRTSHYVVGAGGAVWRTPSRWGGGSIPPGTCAKRQNDNSYYNQTERRVTSTSSLEFGPEWSEDGFILGIDSPSVPNRSEYRVESPQSADYELNITVRPAESIDLYAYFKSNCAGVTGLSTTWDLDDDGDFETTSAVGSVETGTTWLTTPRQRTSAGDSDYEGLDATFVQSKATLSASAPGGAMTGGGGRFVGVKLTSAYGSSSYRFALVARPVKLTGRIGVSINSAARFTDSADVDLSMVWPEGATTAIISNDGSFADAQEIPVASSVRWRLPSEGTGYLPTTVYVRFKNLYSNGQGSWDTGEGDINYTDDIVLDLSPPEVESLSAASTSTARAVSLSSVSTMTAIQKATVTLSAFDGASGIASMQVTSDPAVPGPERVFSRQITIPIDRGSIAVRVKDNIGLWSPWSFARVSGFVAQQPNTPTPPDTPTPPNTPSTPSVPSTPTAPGGGSGRNESPSAAPSPQKESISTSPAVTAPAVVAGPPAFSAKLPSANIGASVPKGTATIASKVAPSAKTVANAPVTSVKTTQAVKPSVSGLAKNASVAATITIGGKKVNLGSLQTSSLGRVTLPAMQIKAKGTYVVTLKVAGKTTYIKIKVK